MDFLGGSSTTSDIDDDEPVRTTSVDEDDSTTATATRTATSTPLDIQAADTTGTLDTMTSGLSLGDAYNECKNGNTDKCVDAGKSLSPSAIAGIVVGAILGVGIAYLIWRRCKRKRENQDKEHELKMAHASRPGYMPSVGHV